MINQKNTTSYNDEFGEKCRKALEKSYGTAIPIPQNNNRKTAKTSKVTVLHTKRSISKAKVLLGLIGIIPLFWGIGVSTRIWANPIFAFSWVISNGLADSLSYVGSGIGALLLALTVIIYHQKASLNKQAQKKANSLLIAV